MYGKDSRPISKYKKDSEKYSESRQTSKMELFAKIVNDVQNSVKCLGWSENS